MHSLTYIDTVNKNDIVIQMARCSFDIHVQEILGTLMIGGTLVMLRPKGTIDFDYLSNVLEKKQISYMHTVPSLIHSFFTFIKECNNRDALKYLRSLCSSGESFIMKFYAFLKFYLKFCRRTFSCPSS
jgi:non-ribosomal peptide synthetase component F